MKAKGLLLFGGAVAAAATLGAIFSPDRGATRQWYRELEKPSFNPPDSVFAPVWTTLYSLMALAAYRVWEKPESRERTLALRFWALQLILNGAWSPLFFGAQSPEAALADMSLLLPSIAASIAAAAKVDGTAAWMLAPYGAWSGFAAAINGEIVRLNRRRPARGESPAPPMQAAGASRVHTD